MKRPATATSESPREKEPATSAQTTASVTDERPRKLSYREKQELEELPDRIDTLETRQAEIHDLMASPEFFRQDGAAIADVQNELQQLTEELENCYQRWEELE